MRRPRWQQRRTQQGPIIAREGVGRQVTPGLTANQAIEGMSNTTRLSDLNHTIKLLRVNTENSVSLIKTKHSNQPTDSQLVCLCRNIMDCLSSSQDPFTYKFLSFCIFSCTFNVLSFNYFMFAKNLYLNFPSRCNCNLMRYINFSL